MDWDTFLQGAFPSGTALWLDTPALPSPVLGCLEMSVFRAESLPEGSSAQTLPATDTGLGFIFLFFYREMWSPFSSGPVCCHNVPFMAGPGCKVCVSFHSTGLRGAVLLKTTIFST